MLKSHNNKKLAITFFVIALIAALTIFGLSIIKTWIFNQAEHCVTFAGQELLAANEAQSKEVHVSAGARSATWSKAFDFHNEGITEHNYQAYTYDFTISNNTGDEVDTFQFKLTFGEDLFLLSAWNGSLEIHQNVQSGNEIVATVPDLRDYNPDEYPFEMFVADGESLIHVKKGDYLIYYPNTSMNALEMPLEPYEATTPGLIMYAEIGEEIDDLTVELDYSFHRMLTREPLFWVSVVVLGVWLFALANYVITSIHVKKYNDRHERDREIINESIETFTGFIDAKDPYTNGHSKRVAKYTRRIAQEFGYDGEELDRIYFIALLHDCGKIGVPDNILGKPGKLTDEEFETIKSHTVRGGEILSSFKSLENAGEGALYHHERYDGKGYPEGKKGEEIPFIARMICVADSYDAMNSNRVYRNRRTKEFILQEIETNKGKQFDPKIADVAMRLIKENLLEE